MDLKALKAVMPRAPEAWLLPILERPQWYGIDTPAELASFVAQIAVESDELTRLEENLNYSAQGLANTWARFSVTKVRKGPPTERAFAIQHNPQRIANIVYANRLGNGDEASGDGWAHRGMGPIQLTGKRNQEKCGKAINQPLVNRPELLLVPAAGIESACWFWKVNLLDRFDDDDSAEEESVRVNGGDHGIERRQAYLDKGLREFA